MLPNNRRNAARHHTMMFRHLVSMKRKNSKFLIFFALIVFVISYNKIKYAELSKLFHINKYSYGKMYPGAYVKYLKPTQSNKTYCKFNYGLPRQLIYENSDLSATPEFGYSKTHRILYTVISAKFENPYPPGVTYATHITNEFIEYIPEVIRLWEGPISIAAYIPNGNPEKLIQNFINLCYCIPGMSRVSLHLVFPSGMPIPKKIDSFSSLPPKQCDIRNIISDETLNNDNIIDDNSVSSNNSIANNWYPINVCRNAARHAAYTQFVMVCDIELMPSLGLASRFMKMIQANDEFSLEKLQKRHLVFVVPVFEIDASIQSIPRTKLELVDLINREHAVYFHRMVCTHCQKFPGMEYWKRTYTGDKIKPLMTAKREAPYHRWEPIYIGTNNEPFYNEQLSWEGFQDKMLQMLEMCLMEYKMIVLDGAFLVHWPGIKTKKTMEPWRTRFKEMNQRQYDSLLRKLMLKYKANPQCRLK